ncbi:hypothetical protein [Tsukamurella soli]|uniref:hypothetical protein n=1 Tax=Tsukamurella soli TaxID=644556 RepID=UPI003617688C
MRLLEIGDQEAFLEPSHPAWLSFPVDEFARIADWLDATVPAETAPVTVALRDSAAVGHTEDGRAIVTRLRTVGEMLTWETAIEGTHDDALDVFVAHSLGQYVRSGPSRLFYEAALGVALRGGRGVRYDRPTVGESGTAAEDDDYLPLYTRGYISAGTTVLDALDPPPGAEVVQSGICVGSWMAAHGTLHARRAGIAADSTAVLVNPLMWRLTPVGPLTRLDLAYGDLAGTPRAEQPYTFATRAHAAVMWRVGRLAPVLRRLVPRSLWRGVGTLPMVQFPDAVFETFAADATRVRLVFAPGDFRHFVESTGGPEAIRASAAPVAMTVTGTGDHTAYHIEVRRAVVNQVLAALGLDGSRAARAARRAPGTTA